MKLLRKIALALGLFSATFVGGLTAIAATNLTVFTGPSGTNPINFPSSLADFNTVIIALNNLLNATFNASAMNALVPSPPGTKIFGTAQITASTNSSSLQTLGTYVLPANYFDTAGRKLHIRAHVTASALNSDPRACEIDFGPAVTFNTGLTATNFPNCAFDMVVTNGITANTQLLYALAFVGSATSSTAGQFSNNSISSYNTGNPLTLAVKSQDSTGSAGSMTLDEFTVLYEQ